MIPDPLTFLIRVGATVADLADHLPGDNAAQRLAALGLACVGVLTLTTAIAVLAVALGVCL